jgi:uncharacterized protein (DUF1330 family)
MKLCVPLFTPPVCYDGKNDPLELLEAQRDRVRNPQEGTMAAYIVAFVDIHDRARFAQEYLPMVGTTIEGFGGRLLAASDETISLEGNVPPGRTVILEFPDLDSARQWHASAAYAPLLALRTAITTSVVAVMPGGMTLHD